MLIFYPIEDALDKSGKINYTNTMDAQLVLDRIDKLEKRMTNMEKKLVPFLESLDQKNYRLWKAKLKVEEELEKLKKELQEK